VKRSAAVLVLSFLALFATAVQAEVTLARIFTDHAVLQRDKVVPVWGNAEPGEKITLTFAGQTTYATAAPDGRWLAYLQPLTASRTGADFVVTGNTTVTVP
jgi:sialate O-acetylesterase